MNTTDPSGNPPSKRLTAREWVEIKYLWETGDYTLSMLSDKFGIRADTIQARLKKEGSQKGAMAHVTAERVKEKIEDETAKEVVENIRRVKDTKNTHYKWAEAIGQMVMQEIIDAKKHKTAIGTKDANIAALGKAAKALEIVRKERYVLLGLDKEDGDPEDMPELLVSELTPEMIEQMQAQMRGLEGQDLSEIDTLLEADDDTVIEGE